jgi:hypothetical protein
MGAYYIADCHACRVTTMIGKYTREGAEAAFASWRKDHADHDAELTTDYDEYAEARRDGRRVVADGYYGLETVQETQPYVETERASG